MFFLRKLFFSSLYTSHSYLNIFSKCLLIFSIFSFPVSAKIIERKMHMVCKENEEAYWNGSTGVCCDGEAYLTDSSADSQVYACCATDKEVSVVEGAPEKQHCCPKGQKAYYGTYYTTGFSRFWFETENSYTSSSSTGIFCCSNDPNSDEQVCCSSGHLVLSEDTTSLKTYVCGGDEYCQARYGKDSMWTPYEENKTYNESFYSCGGDGYCRAKYGAGHWTKQMHTTNMARYGCGGDDYCKAVEGAGVWTINEQYLVGTLDTSYTCGGDDYCHLKQGSNTYWGCFFSEGDNAQRCTCLIKES